MRTEGGSSFQLSSCHGSRYSVWISCCICCAKSLYDRLLRPPRCLRALYGSTANVIGVKTPSYWRVTLWETEGSCIGTFTALFNEIFDLFIFMNGLCWKYSGGLQSYPLYKAANLSIILGQNQGQLFVFCSVILKDAKLLKYCKSYVQSRDVKHSSSAD